MADFIFSIGLIPVQEFIAEARRSKDLRGGSALLSWFISQLLGGLEDELNKGPNTGFEVQLPAGNKYREIRQTSFSKILDDEKYSLPNRASGYCQGESLEAVQQTFQKVNESLSRYWEQLFKEEAFSYESRRKSGMDDRIWSVIQQSFQQNPDCPVQMVWALMEIQEKNWQKDSQAIDQLYGDAKRTRPIPHWNGRAIGKCDQCGRREDFSTETQFINWRKRRQQFEALPWVQSGRRVDSGERLCIVCLIKRFAGYLTEQEGEESKFPSTNAIAAASWVKEVRDLSEFKSFDGRRKALGKKIGDPEKLYYDRSIRALAIDVKEGKFPDISSKEIEVLKESKRKLRPAIESNLPNIKPEPSNYLAVMVYDGDDMGKHAGMPGVAGKIQKFNEAILTQFRGSNTAKLFYAGGDEGILLSSLETALTDANTIRKNFRKIFGEKISLSIGLTVFDHERPLGMALRLAHQGLEAAKSLKGKDGLTVTIQTASGNVFSVTEKWGSDWERINSAIKMINERKLSMSWAHDVETFLHGLPDQEWSDPSFRKPVTVEMKRITYRKTNVQGYSGDEKTVVRNKMWNNLQGQKWIEGRAERGQGQISNQLHAIAFLARESLYKTEYITETPEGDIK